MYLFTPCLGHGNLVKYEDKKCAAGVTLDVGFHPTRSANTSPLNCSQLHTAVRDSTAANSSVWGLPTHTPSSCPRRGDTFLGTTFSSPGGGRIGRSPADLALSRSCSGVHVEKCCPRLLFAARALPRFGAPVSPPGAYLQSSRKHKYNK